MNNNTTSDEPIHEMVELNWQIRQLMQGIDRPFQDEEFVETWKLITAFYDKETNSLLDTLESELPELMTPWSGVEPNTHGIEFKKTGHNKAVLEIRRLIKEKRIK